MARILLAIDIDEQQRRILAIVFVLFARIGTRFRCEVTVEEAVQTIYVTGEGRTPSVTRTQT